MSDETQNPSEAPQSTDVTQIERDRVTGILQAARSANLGQDWVERSIQSGRTLSQVRAEALEKMAAASDAQPVIHAQSEGGLSYGSAARGGQTAAEKFVAGASAWLFERSGTRDLAEKAAAHKHEKIELDGGGFRGLTLPDLARESLERNGVRTRTMNKERIVGLALTRLMGENTTSDFSVLLENVMSKHLEGAYVLADDTWSRFCGQKSTVDFRPSNHFRTGSFGVLDSVAEGQEYKNKNIPDGLKQTISVQTWGNIVALSRQAIVNDDMGALTETMMRLGEAAKLTIENSVYALLNANSGLGFLPDGSTPFFSSGNANLNASGSALGVQGIDADRVVLASQKDISANEYLGLAKYGSLKLLVPIGLGGLARNVNKSTWDITQSNKFEVPNVVQGLFADVIDTPRLTGTRRYIFSQTTPAIVVAFLQGQATPWLENRMGWRVDGTELKVRIDYQAQWFDPKGAVTNAGT